MTNAQNQLSTYDLLTQAGCRTFDWHKVCMLIINRSSCILILILPFTGLTHLVACFFDLSDQCASMQLQLNTLKTELI